MDFALAQLALVFLPGIIWANIDARYGAGARPSQAELFLRIFLFGLTSYAALFGLYFLFGQSFTYPFMAEDRLAKNWFELKDEIAFSIPLSFVLAVCWLRLVRRRVLAKFLAKMNVIKRYPDEDLWNSTFNSDTADVEYVHVRDLENGLTFAGWVKEFSESEEFPALLLRDVIVYNAEGREISTAPLLYLSRSKDNIWIEFPYRESKTEASQKPEQDHG